MNPKKGLFFGIIFAFFALGVIAIQKATPEKKEERIYKAIKVYSPYTFEQSMGGLTIIDKRTDTKEKPDAADALYRMDELEKKWGAKHLRVENNDLNILGDNNQTIIKIFIQTPKERTWLHNFYGI